MCQNKEHAKCCGWEIREETTCFRADPKALFSWEVFASLKSMAIWMSVNKTYATGANTDPIIGYGGI